MARFINQTFRQKMIRIVREHVEKKYDQSPFGQEFRQLEKTAAKELRKLIVRLYPKEDMDVLKKYNNGKKLGSINVIVDTSGRILYPYSGSSGNAITFNTPVDIPINADRQSIISNVKDEQQLKDILVEFIRVSEVRKCEIRKIVDAYMARTCDFRTVETMLKAFPDMECMVPKVENNYQKTTVSDGEKLIASLNDSIVEA